MKKIIQRSAVSDTDISSLRYSSKDTFDEMAGYKTHFKFYFFEKGSGILSINGRSISLIGPCCLCINEAETVKIIKLSTYILHSIYFTPSIVNDSFTFDNIRLQHSSFSRSEIMDLYWMQTFLERTDSYNGSILAGPSSSSRILELCNNIGNELTAKTDSFWPCRSRSFFFELLNLLNTLRLHPLKVHSLAESSEINEIHSVIQYLNEHYHQKITISDLTEIFEINRTTLSQQFSKTTGMTIISYLTKVRLTMACMLLRDTTLPVSEIMYRTGFEDSTHFGRVFKKETSFSPSQYREKKYGN